MPENEDGEIFPAIIFETRGPGAAMISVGWLKPLFFRIQPKFWQAHLLLAK